MSDVVREVPEEFTDLVSWAKAAKEGAVARPFDDPGDIEWRITWYRDDQIVANGITDQVDRDRGLQMFDIGARGFDADMADVAMDAHMTDQRFQERYGRLPDPGELQHLCDNEGACEIGLTTDCIMAMRVWRDGHAVMISLPYHVDRRRNELEFARGKGQGKKAMRTDPSIVREGEHFYHQKRWTHWIDDQISVLDDRTDEKLRVGGRVFDAMRASLKAPSLLEQAIEQGIGPGEFGLDPQYARWHTDMAVVRVLSSAGFMVAVAIQNDEHEQLVRHSMAHSDVIKMVGMDGEEIDLSAEKSEMGLEDHLLSLSSDLQGIELRQRLQEQARKSHERDAEVAAERRAQRAGDTATEEDRRRLEAEWKEMEDEGQDARQVAIEQVIRQSRAQWDSMTAEQRANVIDRVTSGLGVSREEAVERVSKPPCPSCGMSDLDRGPTGVDACRTCGRLSRGGVPI